MTKGSERVATRGIDFVMYIVKDMERARRFYESAFELAPTEFCNAYYTEYLLPDGNAFALARDPSEPWIQLGGAMFHVDDLEAAVARVESAGAKVERRIDAAICRTAWCSDTEGNYFGLHQPK